jgi:hypothetical protein
LSQWWWWWWIFWMDFGTVPNCQVSRNSVQWEPSCSMRTYRQTYRHDEANNCTSQFCERAV